MLTIKQVESSADAEAARELIREYTDWVLEMDPRGRQAPTFVNLEAELAGLPGEFVPPKARLLLARIDGEPAGCICLRDHGAELCELKRLYVRPGFRGLQIGRQLVERLIEEAHAAGYGRIRLDSHHTMKTAHAVYEAAGFRYVEPPADFPDEFRDLAVFMERELTQG